MPHGGRDPPPSLSGGFQPCGIYPHHDNSISKWLFKANFQRSPRSFATIVINSELHLLAVRSEHATSCAAPSSVCVCRKNTKSMSISRAVASGLFFVFWIALFTAACSSASFPSSATPSRLGACRIIHLTYPHQPYLGLLIYVRSFWHQIHPGISCAAFPHCAPSRHPASCRCSRR